MASISRQLHVPGVPHVIRSAFSLRRPKIDSLTPTKELVSVLKRLITEADNEAKDAAREGNTRRLVDLRIAAAYSSQKLRNVIDGKVRSEDVEGELRQALNVIVNTLY